MWIYMGYGYVQVSSKTYRDNTGRSIDFPTLLVEYNR